MFDLGRETDLAAMGKVWKVGRLEISVIEKFIVWVRQQCGDPFASLEKILPFLVREDALAEVKAAKERRAALEHMDYTSPILQEWLNSTRGQLHAFLLMLQVNHPDATLNIAFDIAMEVGQDKLAEAMAAGRGKIPAPAGNSQAPAA